MDVVYTCLSISIDSPPPLFLLLHFCFMIRFFIWQFLSNGTCPNLCAIFERMKKEEKKMDETMCPGKTKTKRKEKGVVQNGRLSATRSPGQFFFCVFQLMTLFSSMSIYTRWWYSKPLWSLKNKKICWNPGDDKPPTSLRIKNKKNCHENENLIPTGGCFFFLRALPDLLVSLDIRDLLYFSSAIKMNWYIFLKFT